MSFLIFIFYGTFWKLLRLIYNKWEFHLFDKRAIPPPRFRFQWTEYDKCQP